MFQDVKDAMLRVISTPEYRTYMDSCAEIEAGTRVLGLVGIVAELFIHAHPGRYMWITSPGGRVYSLSPAGYDGGFPPEMILWAGMSNQELTDIRFLQNSGSVTRDLITYITNLVAKEREYPAVPTSVFSRTEGIQGGVNGRIPDEWGEVPVPTFIQSRIKKQTKKAVAGYTLNE